MILADLTVSSLLARVAAATRERARAEAAMAPRFAPRFNGVALLAPGETQLSAVLGWLLDETETHGQGGVFRDIFLSDVLAEDPIHWASAHVATEVATGDRLGRIDLLLTSHDKSRCLVIENKPWAAWQSEQLLRYLGDRQKLHSAVRVHALIGNADPETSLGEHWAASSLEPLPATVTASGFEGVVAWLERCAEICRAERVRNFIDEVASYCRAFVMGETSMEEINATADLILSAGDGSLDAARSIAAALPFALTREIARLLGVSMEIVGVEPSLRVETADVVFNFVLFSHHDDPWAGVTTNEFVPKLAGAVAWGKHDPVWPRWGYLRNMGEDGRLLLQAVQSWDPEAIVQLIPAVARTMIGAERSV